MPYPTKKLGEIGNFIRGVTYKKGDLLSGYENGCITLLRANNINNGLVLEELQFLPFGFISDEKILKENDIIFCMSSGSRHLVGKNTIISDLKNHSFGAFCSMFRLNSENNINFVSYFLKSDLYKNYIFNFSQGINILNLKNSHLENLEIPLPPLKTQTQIVQKLDSSFEKIDKSIKKVKEDLENLEELNKSFLEEIFGSGEFEIKKLGEISKTTSGGTPLRSNSVFWGGKIPWLKSGELADNLKINKSSEFITEDGLNNSSTKIFKKGTLLIALYGATAGKLGILDFDASTNQAVCSIQNIYNSFYEKYIYYFLLTKRKQIIKNSFGGAQPNISKGYLDNIEIPLPPIKTQKQIVQKLDKIFEKNNFLKEKFLEKLKNLEEMKQSLLKKAFEGRLV